MLCDNHIAIGLKPLNADRQILDIMDINFINGKSIIKSGRKIIAKVYYRPEFFKGTKVSWDTRYPYCLEMNGMSAQCTSINEVIELFQSEI